MGKLADDFITALHQLEETSDVNGITALFSDNAVLSNPLAVHDAEDGGAAKAFWTAYRAPFEKISSEFVNLAEGDSSAMLEWRSDGTLRGQAVSYSGVSVLEFADDRITSFRAYFDPRELVAHVGSPQTSEDMTPSDVEPASQESQ
ncbi:nuclear transport factor 2 family protein (plasmid) [Aliirhizobium terrae]|uniref:nuclear transport factor 2 family protein n=1 Tax=Terrirhizobium terrae TaxID=2926709 RepID=UPI002577A155|nr:nuclear transport factor 2 family protein [Rhizobium sp. CC-CFT758]WJH38694.1 nuclear transport factor 2 family protein [Rhizobium sp. CC-CFT758]